MKLFTIIAILSGLLITSGCHAHKKNKVVVVKKGHNNDKVILIDNDHRRKNYRIVRVKPNKKSVCKKHKKHWHCV